MKTGVEVQQASADFDVNGKHYPAGSYVVLTAQAFRPQVLDMFEPQDHPNDFPYPGGPPNRPYDATGWTLAYQMGVHFDRYTEPFTGPYAPIKTDLAVPVPGTITGVSGSPPAISSATSTTTPTPSPTVSSKPTSPSTG